MPDTNLRSGHISEAIDFYWNGRDWTQICPEDIEEPTENDVTAQYAILKRIKKPSDSRKKFTLHSIVVQSPLVKAVLGKVFKGYDGITTSLDRLEFKAPFKPFVHRWEKFRLARDSEKDSETSRHLDLLWNTLHEELEITLATIDDLLSNGVMTYDLLWTIFEPKKLVFMTKGADESERVMIVENSNYILDTFQVVCRYVEWNGLRFGMAGDYAFIDKFTGTKRITELSTYPLAYHPDSIGVQRRCIARGREWESYCCYSFMQYTGVASLGKDENMHIDSRVIIDTQAYNTFNPKNQISVQYLSEDRSYIPPPLFIDEDEPADKILTPWQLLLATDQLRAYSLKDKAWITISLSGICNITWNDTAFTRLVLPSDTKDLVLAFAKSQIQREQTFDDFIQGKGKGVIMLLSGPPGVGKTLTPEAVAETMKVPLYVMAAGDLGTDSSEVERELKKICAMTTKWKAVLLLDEAEVYLEARSTHDLERNKLVCIFLRVLEYYEGFLFLTSNRVDNIDAAFESRIHLSLRYQGLSFESRREVWRAFTMGWDFTEEQIERLAGIELNGRQIKNILKTAQLLATSKDVKLSYGHVRTITELRASNTLVGSEEGGAFSSTANSGNSK